VEAVVGQELRVELFATDPDGDDVRFTFDAEHESLAEDGRVLPTPDGRAVFRWTPLGSDVGTWPIEFVASDGRTEDRRGTVIDVRESQDGSPVFREPVSFGAVLDVQQKPCIDVRIAVDDPDDLVVTIGQEEVLEGAVLEIRDGLRAVWEWCPSKAQLETSSHQTAFFAEDGKNPRVTKYFQVWLDTGDGAQCPGQAPVLQHEAEDIATIFDIPIEADISDEIGLREEPVVLYTFDEPKLPVDLAQFDVAPMDLIEGTMASGRWKASIPNPVADQAVGASARVYYILSATDNDDAAGPCDHRTLEPSEGAFEIIVRNPGDQPGAGLCEPCSVDAQCGGPGDLCLVIDGDERCAAACNGASCPVGYMCVSSTSVQGTSAEQCVPTTTSCEPPDTCTDDEFEDNDSRTQAQTNAALAAGIYSMAICDDDPDWYRLEIVGDTDLQATSELMGMGDITLSLLDASGASIASSLGGGTGIESIQQCLSTGTYYLRITESGATQGTYELDVALSPDDCESQCVDDAAEDDDTIAQATYANLAVGGYSTSGRQICAWDDDYFEVQLYTNEELVVDLTFADADLDLHFLDSAGVDLTPCSEEMYWLCTAAQGQSATPNEHFEYSVGPGCTPCTFYVVVHGYAGAQDDYGISMSSHLQ
jgi:hypothetical protein